jgi:hypothetical protein
MTMECDLGTLIRMCNPYGGGGPGTMHIGPSAPPTVAELQAAAAPEPEDLGRYEIEVDNYDGEWTFMGMSHRVTRALRIKYRFPLRDTDGNPTGVYATQYLLVGYAGGNGP